MTSIKGRLLKSDSEPLLRSVAATVSAIALLSFILSFSSLTDLAIAAHIPHPVAWGWGLIVDGTIVVATFGTLLLHDRANPAVRVYPWAILVLFGALSIHANGIHALAAAVTPAEAYIVGAVAPFALLTSTHMVVIMLTSPVRGASDDQLVKIAAAEARAAVQSAQPARQVPSSVPTAQPRTEAPTVSRAVVGAPESGAVVGQIHRWREQHGQWPSGAQVGRWLEKSAKTGGRLLEKVKAVA